MPRTRQCWASGDWLSGSWSRGPWSRAGRRRGAGRRGADGQLSLGRLFLWAVCSRRPYRAACCAVQSSPCDGRASPSGPLVAGRVMRAWRTAVWRRRLRSCRRTSASGGFRYRPGRECDCFPGFLHAELNITDIIGRWGVAHPGAVESPGGGSQLACCCVRGVGGMAWAVVSVGLLSGASRFADATAVRASVG